MTLTEALTECAAAKAKRDACLVAWKAVVVTGIWEDDCRMYDAWSEKFWNLHYEHNAAHREVMRIINERLDQ